MAKESIKLLPPPPSSEAQKSGTYHVTLGSVILPKVRAQIDAPVGATVADALNLSKMPPSLRKYAVVALNGERIPFARWNHVRPKAGATLAIAVIPGNTSAGGAGSASLSGGKETQRLLGGVVSWLAAIAVPELLGLSGAWAWLAQGVIGFAGLAAVNALIPVPEVPEPTNRFGLNGTRNKANPYGIIPKIYGKHRTYPPLAAMPFTHSGVDQQDLYILYCVGYGPLKITDMRIGDTPIEDYTNIQVRRLEGRPDDPALQIFTQDVYQDSFSAELNYAPQMTTEIQRVRYEGPVMVSENFEGVVQRTSAEKAIGLAVELTFPNGLYKRYDDGNGNWRVDIHIQFRRVGDGDQAWVDVPALPDMPLEQSLEILELSAQFWQDLEALADQFDIENAAIATITSVDRSVRDGFRDKAAEDITRAVAKLTILDTTDGDGEPAGYREGILTQLLDAYQDFSDLLDTFYDAAGTEGIHHELDGYISLVRQFSDFAESVAEVEAYIQQGYGPDISTLPQWQQYLIRQQNLEIVFSTTPAGAQTLIDNQAGTIRRTIGPWPVLEGQYEVRVRRASRHSGEDSNVVDDVAWAGLKTFQAGRPVRARNAFPEFAADTSLPYLALVEMRVTATDQFSGTIDQFSCIAEAMLPYYDSGSGEWRTANNGYREGALAAGRNPAWALVDVLTGPQNARPLDRDNDLDLSEILTFASWCEFDTDANGAIVPLTGFYFDQVIDNDASVRELALAICGSAQTALHIRDGVWTVITDTTRSVPVQHFTPRNSRNFRITKTLINMPHALKVRFIDASADWQENEWIVYADGYGESNVPDDERIETIDTVGVVDAPQTSAYHTGQVHRIGRYHLAALKLRPEQFFLNADIENIVAERGDLVTVTHNVTLWGLGSARITSVTRNGGGDITAIGIDEAITLPTSSGPYSLRIRTATNTLHEPALVANDTESATLTLSSAYDDSAEVAVGDLLSYGVTGLVSVNCIVKEVTPKQDLSADLLLVEYNEAVYTSATEEIPPFDSKITRPPEIQSVRPIAPIIDSIVTNEAAVIRLPGGGLQSRILINLGPMPIYGGTVGPAYRNITTEIEAIEVQYRETLDSALATERGTSRFPIANAAAGIANVRQWQRLPYFTQAISQIAIPEVEEGLSYDLRVRYITRLGVASEWVTRENVEVIGQSTPPPDILTVDIIGGGRVLTWEYNNAPIDLAGFYVRFHTGNSTAGWGKARPAHSGIWTVRSFDIPELDGGTRTYLIRAVDVSGNLSDHAARVVVTLPARDANIILTQDERSYSWAGIIRNGSVSGGDLVADADTSPLFWGDPLATFWGAASDPFWRTATYKKLTYEATVTIEAADVPSQITIEATVTGDYRIEYRKDNQWQVWPDALGKGNRLWPLDLRNSFWPEGFAFQSVPDVLDAIEEGTITFRIVVEAGTTQGVIEQFKIHIDVPDIIEYQNNQTITSGGSRLALGKTYRAITEVIPSLNYNASYANAVRVIVDDKDESLGPLLHCEQSDGSGTGGVIDAIIKGY